MDEIYAEAAHRLSLYLCCRRYLQRGVGSRATPGSNKRPPPPATYSATVSASYDYRFGRGAPFKPSNALTEGGGFIPAGSFPTASYCGHCHAAAYREWQESLHRNSFREPFYQNNVNLLINTKGIAYTRHCEGCHNPIALFSGALTANSHLDRSFDADGLTCSVCHSIIKLQPLLGNGAYVMAVPAVMVDAAGRRIPGVVPDAEILAHPDRHRQAVMQPFYRSPEFCATCHRSTVPAVLSGHDWIRGFETFHEWQASAYSNRSPVPFYAKPTTTCQNCHMPPAPAGPGELAARNGVIASHRWAAGNTAVPFYYGSSAQLQRTQAFLKNQKLRVDIFGLKPAGGKLAAPLGRVPVRLRPGEVVQALVLIKNVGLGHSLIPEQRDFFQAWVRFTVTGAGGHVLWQSGGLRPDGTLDPSAHSFTNRLIAADGTGLRDHQIWLRRAVAFDHTVPSGHTALVRYQFRVPDDASGAITLTAAVEYRHFNQHYLNHVLGPTHPVYPVVEMARASRTFPASNAPHSPAPPDHQPQWRRWNDFGIALLDQGNYAQAKLAFSQVSMLRPSYADAFTNIAAAELDLSEFGAGAGNAAKALLLARAAGDARAAARALYYRGLIERDQTGALAASVRDLQAVARLYPQSPDILHQLGVSAYLASDSAGARSAFEAALARDPYDLLAHFYLATLYRRAGLAKAAQEQAALYEQEKPELGQRLLALAFLRRHPELRPESVSGHVHIEPGAQAPEPKLKRK